MSKDTFAQSAAYLKQAVPLRIKYQIPTTPDNYHLWYNYVSASMPELNQAIDQAVKMQGTCSLTTCERLYHQYLAAQDEKQMEAMKLSLAAMANELGHSMQDAISDTGMFQEMLDKSFDKLSRIDDEGFSLEDTMGILRELVRGIEGCAHVHHALSQPAQQCGERDQRAAGRAQRDTQTGQRGCPHQPASTAAPSIWSWKD